MSIHAATYSKPHFVYSCYGTDGTLLYIGSTASLARRMREHRNLAEWPALVAEIRTVKYADRSTGRAAERLAIFHGKPAHNRQQYPGEAYRRSA